MTPPPTAEQPAAIWRPGHWPSGPAEPRWPDPALLAVTRKADRSQSLMAAAVAGKVEMTRQLLAAGADPRRRLRTGAQAGRTAMDLAAEHGHATVVALLVDQA